MHSILLTIDVEDWFQVENFKGCIPFSSWPSCELRVQANTHRILDLLDACGSISATFFILGWIAERMPHLVREIHARGHEVASHGCIHNLCCEMSCEDLDTDLKDSKKLLEDITGALVSGYRAPSFAVTEDILRRIEEAGYFYDSSYNSFGLHGRYGKVTLPRNGQNGVAFKLAEYFYELPISNITLGKWVLPWGGGGYFRLIPPVLFGTGVRSILNRDGAYVFYFHPWEIDPDQPRVHNAKRSFKFRHYTNLEKTYSRLSKLMKHFNDCHFMTCRQYLASLTEVTETAEILLA